MHLEILIRGLGHIFSAWDAGGSIGASLSINYHYVTAFLELAPSGWPMKMVLWVT